MTGSSAVSLAGIGKPCGQVAGPVERDEEPVLDLLGQLVLEVGGEPVGLVPGVAEHVGEEPLDDAVAADRRRSPGCRPATVSSTPWYGSWSTRPRSARRLTVAVTVPGDRPSRSARTPVWASPSLASR